jgi:hypothetical protein
MGGPASAEEELVAMECMSASGTGGFSKNAFEAAEDDRVLPALTATLESLLLESGASVRLHFEVVPGFDSLGRFFGMAKIQA